MAHNRRLRSDAAPFRPSAAAATHPYAYAYAGANIHHPFFADACYVAGQSGYLHGYLYAAERHRDEFLYYTEDFMSNPNIPYPTARYIFAPDGEPHLGEPHYGTQRSAGLNGMIVAAAAPGGGPPDAEPLAHAHFANGHGFASLGGPRRGVTEHAHDAIGDLEELPDLVDLEEPLDLVDLEEPLGLEELPDLLDLVHLEEPLGLEELRHGGAGHPHDAIGEALEERRHGVTGHPHDAIGEALEEPRHGVTGHPHHAIGEALEEPRHGGVGHPHDAIGEALEDGGAAPAHDVNVDGFGFSYANCAASCTVQSVWHDNCAEVFEHVVAEPRQPRRRLYAALDLEFVADASIDVAFRALSLDQWYHHLRAFVNGGDVVQVGLALAFEHEHHHGGPSSPVITLEINLEFDEDARHYNATSIDFLAEQGHRLAEHKNRGVPVKEFLDGLMRHLMPGGHDDPITWIMFHGDNDLGFLMRLLQGALPSDRATFMREVRRQFPKFYDLRVLGQMVQEWFSGKFSFLAELLRVERVGREHHAGSDALLAMSCFSEILRRSQHELRRFESRKCLLSGMEDLNMPIKCARHIGDVTYTVEVRGHNFDKEALEFVELVTGNFKIVGVHVLLPPLGWDRGSPLCAAAEPLRSASDEQKDYDMMKSSLEGIRQFQVEIGFMNAEGMLAFGRVWRFYLRRTNAKFVLAGENDCVDPRRLAWLLASCGATHNSDIAWATYQGSEGIACLIKSSLQTGDLPGDWSSYNEHRRARFPGMYDVGLIAQRWPDTGLLPTGCRGTLYDIARNLKVIKNDDRHPMENVLRVLRCYQRLEESPHFSLIASGVRGQLMASQGCCR